MGSPSCPICGTPATKTCSACHQISYCSTGHQKSDWNVHKKSCRIFEIKCNEQFGRYTVASRDITPGTIIMDEAAIMISPKQETNPVCLGCNKNLSAVQKKYYCSKCLIFPMCGPDCEKIPIHADNECHIFAETKPNFKPIKNFGEIHPAYECIMTLRCLLLKASDPNKWKKLINMHHLNELRKTTWPDVWHRNQINTVNLLREQCQMTQFSKDDIHTVLGYYYINSFEVKIGQIKASGLFDNSFIMAHDCNPNTHHTFTDDYRMVVRSTVPIKKGDFITTRYAFTLEATFKRRQDLRESKFFDCICQRCSDPTEFGTYFSAIKCKKCPKGYVLPKNPLSNNSEWCCSNSKCQFHWGSQEVHKIISIIEDDISTVKQDDANLIQNFEKLLNKYANNILHPNHFLIIDLESSLLSFYGRKKGWRINDLCLEYLVRKEALCRHVLSVLDVIEPGYSRIRGITLYELHAALYFAANKSFDNNEITTSELKSRLKEILLILEEAKVILSFDSKSTMEGAIAKSIPGSITYITESIDKLIP